MKTSTLIYIIVIFFSVQAHGSFKNDTTKAGKDYRKALMLSDSARYDSAIFYFSRAENIYKKRQLWDKYLRCRGNIFNNRRNKNEQFDAMSYVLESLFLSQKKLGKNHTITGDCFTYLGNVYDDLSISDTAIICFQKALKIYQINAEQNLASIARTYNNIGVMYSDMGQYDSARVQYEHSLKINISLYGENHLSTARVYNSLGVMFYYMGDLKNCLDNLNKVLTIRKKLLGDNHPDVASAYNNLGSTYNAFGKFEECLKAHQTALKIRLASLGPDHPNVALSYNNLGNAYLDLGQFGTALDYHKTALAIRLKLYDEKRPDVLMSYTNIGLTYMYMGIFDEAMPMLRKVLTNTLEKYGEFHRNTADAYNNMGAVFESIGEWDSALYYINKALNVRLQIFSPHNIAIASSYNNIGSVSHSKGDLETALRYFMQSITMYKENFEEHPEIVSGYSNIGAVYNDMEKYDLALQYLNRALEMGKKLMGQNSLDLAGVLNNMSNIYSAQKRYNESLQCLLKSTEIIKEAHGEDHPDVAMQYNNLAATYFDLNDTINAFAVQHKAINILNKFFNGKHPGLALSYNNMGDFFFHNKNYQTALQCYQLALTANCLSFSSSGPSQNPPLKEVLDKPEMLKSLQKKANVLFEMFRKKHNMEHLQLALSTANCAIDLTDDIRKSYELNESKLHFVEKASGVFSLGCDIAFTLYKHTQDVKYLSEAFNLSQKSKAQVLSEIIEQSNALRFAGVPDSIVKLEKKSRSLLSAAEAKLLLFKTGEKKDSITLIKLEEKVFQYSAQYKNVSDLITANYPRFKETMQNREILSLAQIQQRLDKETALLDYFVGDSALFIFTVTNNRTNVQKIKTDSTFNVMVEKMLSGIKKNRDDQFIPISTQLYNKLIRPVASELVGKKRLLIIPDKTLLYVPFEALSSGTSKGLQDYLMRHFATVYNYSTALAFTPHNIPLKDGRHSGNLTSGFIGFAPVFQNTAEHHLKLYASNDTLSKLYTSLRSVAVNGKSYRELVQTEQEIIEVVKLFESKGLSGIGYLHENATEANFKKEIPNYEYVHIATHGISNDEYPSLSGLVFAPVAPDSTKADIGENDGMLFAGEIYDLNINAELVVLSACESGTGKLIRGEGLMSLTRGFLYAGVPQIIYSLWKVDDRSTRELITQFYEGLLQNKPTEEALREAKLKLLDNTATSSPRFWAAFALLGK